MAPQIKNCSVTVLSEPPNPELAVVVDIENLEFVDYTFDVWWVIDDVRARTYSYTIEADFRWIFQEQFTVNRDLSPGDHEVHALVKDAMAQLEA